MAQAVIDSRTIPEGQLLCAGGWSRWTAWALCISSVLASLFLLILFQPSYSGSQHGDSLRSVVAFACIVFGLASVRKIRFGVIVEEDGVVVRSAIGPSRYQWFEINEVQWQPSLTRRALQIHLTDGHRIYAHGFSVRSPDEAQRARDMVAELNRLVTSRFAG
jgi:hypothetical protein